MDCLVSVRSAVVSISLESVRLGVERDCVVAGSERDVARTTVVLNEVRAVHTPLVIPVARSLLELEAVASDVASPSEDAVASLLVKLIAALWLEREERCRNIVTPLTISDVTTDEIPPVRISVAKFDVVRLNGKSYRI